MIDILHLIDTYRIGGPGKTILNSAKFIDGSQYRIHVASFVRPGGASEFAAATRAAGIPYLELPEHRRFDLGAIRRIRDYIKSNQIQVLHSHSYLPDILGFAAVKGTNARMVTTHHGWIGNSTRQRALNWAAMQLCRLFDGVELVSERLREDLPAGFRNAPRVAVVHNAIVLEDYAPRGVREDVRTRLGITANETLLAVIGRLSPEKGCMQMVSAFREVVAQAPHARLAFIGEGPLESELRQAVSRAGLEQAVRFVEHQRHVQPMFEAADIVVSPSLTEGLSNVILESLATERPIVATQVGGNAEIIEHDQTGLLVEPGNPTALANAIGALLRDPSLRERLVRNGANRVQTMFSFPARMRREERFYRAVLDRPNGPANLVGRAEA